MARRSIMDDSLIDWARLERFVRREGTPAELAALEQWVAADSRRRALAEAMRTVGRLPREAENPPRWDAARALRQVERRHGTSRQGNRIPRLALGDRSPRAKLFEFLVVTLGVAAAVVAVVLSGSRHVPRPADASIQPARDVVTGPGKRASLQLADGTRLVLSAESHLRVPAGFGQSRRGAPREVWLEGEAYFAVRHDSVQAFVVHTPLGSVEDLGTEFVMSTYPEVRGLRVAVREGRVAVRSRVDTARLDAGDVARLSDAGRALISRRQNVSDFFAASEGALVLSAATLREAIPRLERWYGIRVRVSEPALLSRKVSGSFRDESATAAMGIIAVALQSKAAWHQNEVTLMADHGPGGEQ